MAYCQLWTIRHCPFTSWSLCSLWYYWSLHPSFSSANLFWYFWFCLLMVWVMFFWRPPKSFSQWSPVHSSPLAQNSSGLCSRSPPIHSLSISCLSLWTLTLCPTMTFLMTVSSLLQDQLVDSPTWCCPSSQVYLSVVKSVTMVHIYIKIKQL